MEKLCIKKKKKIPEKNLLTKICWVEMRHIFIWNCNEMFVNTKH